MKSFSVNKNDSGQRLDKYILKTADIPKSLMYKFLRTGHIKVNKKKKGGEYLLCEGDIVSFFINDEFFSEKKSDFPVCDLDIVFENRDILVVNKPPGVKSQPDLKNDAALSEYIKGYLFNKGEYVPTLESSFTPSLCNRLDVNTCGLVIAAKNAEALRIINKKIKNREILKYYRCTVIGKPLHDCGILEGYILKDREKNKSIILKKPQPGALYVKTGYEVIYSKDNKSLLDIRLYTGRSHQIRAHLASIGCPIDGDYKYGGGFGTQKLCAYKLVFDFKSDGGLLDYLNGKTIKITPYFQKRGIDNEFS